MARDLGDVLHLFLDGEAPGAERPRPARTPAGGRGPDPAAVEPGLAGLLARLCDPLEVLVEDVLGLETRIDAVARDPSGRAWVVLRCAAGQARACLTEGLAQRAWLAPRVRDWARLAPQLRLRPEAGVGLVLLGPGFDSHTREAARDLGPEQVRLVTCRPRAASE